jgi:hypothetical protein
VNQRSVGRGDLSSHGIGILLRDIAERDTRIAARERETLVVRMKMNEVELFAHTRDAFQHREVKGLRARRVFDEPKRGRAGGDKAGARCRIAGRKERHLTAAFDERLVSAGLRQRSR